MKAFVTGGSGFIGQHVIQKLVARGYEVQALVRSEPSAAIVAALGAKVVPGDITDVASMRGSMTGCDVVFHIAGWYKLGGNDWMRAEPINVGGTRKVLRLAHELGIPKIIYTSTVAVLGDTKGELVDETYYSEGPFLSEYDRTKWLAHYKVALPLIEKGAPIIIVMPGAVYGPGDPSSIGDMMRLFARGMPLVPGPETIFTYAHVADIAEGHLLAAEKGRVGESYILAGPAIPLGEMVEFWSHLTGNEDPKLHIPTSIIKPFGPMTGALQAVLPMPSLFNQELVNVLGATYMARSDKAQRELGWQTRPLQMGMVETFDWIQHDIARQQAETVPSKEQTIAKISLGLAALLFIGWLLEQKRNR